MKSEESTGKCCVSKEDADCIHCGFFSFSFSFFLLGNISYFYCKLRSYTTLFKNNILSSGYGRHFVFLCELFTKITLFSKIIKFYFVHSIAWDLGGRIYYMYKDTTLLLCEVTLGTPIIHKILCIQSIKNEIN